MSAIEKTVKRVYERIQRGEFYEAHQAVRTVIARLERQKDHAGAIGLLYTSSVLLARAGQTGSAADLLLYMLSSYVKAGIPVDGTSRGRIAEIVWQLDPRDSVLKQVGKQTKEWAAKAGAPATGDPELNHVFGVQLLRALQPYEAEKYLLSGTKVSAELLADFHHQWFLEADGQSGFRDLFISRGVLGYLTAENIRNAKAYLARSIHHARADGLSHADVGNLVVFSDLKWINFFQLLITVCQTQAALMYKKLVAKYDPKEFSGWGPSFTVIEKTYFGIQPAQQFNIADIMGGMFK